MGVSSMSLRLVGYSVSWLLGWLGLVGELAGAAQHTGTHTGADADVTAVTQPHDRTRSDTADTTEAADQERHQPDPPTKIIPHNNHPHKDHQHMISASETKPGEDARVQWDLQRWDLLRRHPHEVAVDHSQHRLCGAGQMLWHKHKPSLCASRLGGSMLA